MNDETTAACRSSERAFMNAQFARELIKRERLCVSHMLGQAHRDSLDDATRDGSSAAIPHAKRIHGHTKELGALLLRHVGVATQLREARSCVHDAIHPEIHKATSGIPGRNSCPLFEGSSPHSERRDDVIC